MSSITVGAHSRPPQGRWASARRAIAGVRATAADAWARSAARSPGWLRRMSPVLSIGGMACVDVSAYQVNLGVGLLVTGISGLTLGEWFGTE